MNAMLNAKLFGRKFPIETLPANVSFSSLVTWTECERKYVFEKLLGIEGTSAPIVRVGQEISGMALATVEPPQITGDLNEFDNIEVERVLLANILWVLRDKLHLQHYVPEVTFLQELLPTLRLKGIVDGWDEKHRSFLETKYTGDITGNKPFIGVPLRYQLATYFWLTDAKDCLVVVVKRPYIPKIADRHTRIESAVENVRGLATRNPGLFSRSKVYLKAEFEEYFEELLGIYLRFWGDMVSKLDGGLEFLPAPLACGNCVHAHICTTGIVPERSVVC